MKSADTLVAFNRAISEVIGRYRPTTVLRRRSGEKQWLDASCQRANVAKQNGYHALYRAHNAKHWGQFVLARAEAQKVHGAARESHNEMHQEYSEALHLFTLVVNGSIFGVKPSIPALRGPGVVWWWLVLGKPCSWALSLTVSNVVSSLSLL